MLSRVRLANDLAQPMKVDTFNEHWSKHWPTGSHAAQQCISVPKMSVRVSSNNQELCTQAAWRVAKKLMTSPFPGLLDDQLEVSPERQMARRGVLMIVTDLLENSARDRDVWTSKLGMRLTAPQEANGFCMTTRIATWSLGMERSSRLSVT